MKLASRLLIVAGGSLTRWVVFGLLCAGCAYLLWPGFEQMYRREVWNWYLALQAAIQVVLAFGLLYGSDGLACSSSGLLFGTLYERASGKIKA